MISPRSFKYSSISPPSSSNSSPPSLISTSVSTTASPSSSIISSPLSRVFSSSQLSSTSSSSPSSPSSTPPHAAHSSHQSSRFTTTPPRNIPSAARLKVLSHLHGLRVPSYDQDKDDFTRISIDPVPSISPGQITDLDAAMAKRKERRQTVALAPSSSPNPTDLSDRPTTPTSPVQIPKSSKREYVDSFSRRHAGPRRRGKPAVASNPLPPSMAALLAVTDIPRPRRSQRKLRQPDSPLTIDDIFDERQISEKELSWTLSKGTMDMLLTPPELLTEDDTSISDSNVGSALSIRTLSVDSIPSLGESFATDQISSVDTPCRSSSRRRSSGPSRKALEPISSPPELVMDHPLAFAGLDGDDFDAGLLGQPLDVEPEPVATTPFKPLRAVFKSNLTASLRALRSAAKSFSSISFASIPSEDLLTRSLLTMDPKVPYTDERMPPVSDDMPSAEIRRYLNPSTSAHHEAQPATLPAPGSFSASIQMQTYKIKRSKAPSPTTNSAIPNAYIQAKSTDRASTPPPVSQPSPQHPGMRQREMRENPDFIRIAVMEMAMRKRGKLDDSRPGRARWALPPRKAILTPYSVNDDGVPERWVPISQSS